jgi:type I restriction enzyme, S subunit
MSEWKTYKLSDFAELRKEQVTPNGVEQPYIGLEHIEQQSLRLNGIGSSSEVISNKFKFYSGDVLYGKLRPYFRKVYNPKFEGICSTDIFVIKNKENIDNNFLFYLLATEEFTSLANSGSSGTRMPRAEWNQLAKSEWLIPETLNEQTEIASILSSLDEKIELNLQMNQTLEAMAQAIFKEWFVNFNFPKSLNRDSYDLYDDNDAENQKNHSADNLEDGLPRGWRMGKIGEEFNLTMGQSPPGETYNESGDGMVFYQGRTDFGFRFPENRMFTTSPTRIAEKLDTLVSVRAPVGDINMAIEKCCVGRGLSAVRHKSGAYSYTFYAMKSIEPIFKGYEGEGTVFGSINKGNFENIEIIAPSKNAVEQFEMIVNAIDDKIFNNAQEIKSLTQIRDSLLPKLMTGKIEVKG